MSSYTIYKDIPVECGHCHANDELVDFYVWYANQHGAQIRVFCGHCDRYTDLEKLNNKPLRVRLGRTSLHGRVTVLPKGPEHEWHDAPSSD